MSGVADQQTGEPELPDVTNLTIDELLSKTEPGSPLANALLRCAAETDLPAGILSAFSSYVE